MKGRRFARRVVLPLFVLALPGLAVAATVWRVLSAEALAAERSAIEVLRRQMQVLQELGTPAMPSREPGVELPAAPEVALALRAFELAGQDCGVELTTVQALSPTAPGRQPFRLAGRGTPEAVCRLLAALEQGQRPLLFEAGEIYAADAELLAFELRWAGVFAGGGR